MQISPLNNFVVISQKVQQQSTLIYTPEKDKVNGTIGIVTATGPNVGWVNDGDVVVFDKNKSTAVEPDKDHRVIVEDKYILAMVKK
jgi:co-chaperonin GroES (HSP10)